MLDCVGWSFDGREAFKVDLFFFFFFQAEDGIRDGTVTGVQTCALPISYPDLTRAQALITETLKLEESKFRTTLERGLKLLDEAVEKIGSSKTLPGDVAFKLYDTFGFPYDLTEDALRAKGIGVDRAGFDAAMAKQKADARASWMGSGEAATERESTRL